MLLLLITCAPLLAKVLDPELTELRPPERVIEKGRQDRAVALRFERVAGRRSEELGDALDLKRVHFLGKILYKGSVKVLQILRVHVYLTYPFVLLWWMLEGMAAGCLIVGSLTPPVEEVIHHGGNGLLVDFFSPDQIADRVVEALEHRNSFASIRQNARQTVVDRYDLHSICLPAHLRMLNMLVPGTQRVEFAQSKAAASR